MPNRETSSEQYRRLAEEALDVANNFPAGEHRDALLQMAQVWQRLADQYKNATPRFSPAGTAAHQPAMQQQQQIQPDDDKKE